MLFIVSGKRPTITITTIRNRRNDSADGPTVALASFHRLELLPIPRLTGYQLLINPVGAHGTPLVVITPKPGLRDAAPAPVFSYLKRRKMAVVVNNRHLISIVMIQTTGCIIAEDEVIMYEGALCHYWTHTLPDHGTLSGRKVSILGKLHPPGWIV